MATKKNSKVRNAFVSAMVARHPGVTKMKDRRTKRLKNPKKEDLNFS